MADGERLLRDFELIQRDISCASSFAHTENHCLNSFSIAQMDNSCRERFIVSGILGMGGMGVILRALDLKTAQEVALKVIRPDYRNNIKVSRYFIKEIEHLKQLSHPNILKVLDSNTRGDLWFATSYIQPGSLSNLIHQKPLSHQRTLHLGIQIVEALKHAHSRGIIHRDIKPGNVLVNDSDRVFIADFGVSLSFFTRQLMDSENNHDGTPQYQAPNALRGEFGDTRDDVYSAGALLYEMLTGSCPFSGKSRVEVIAEHTAGKPIPLDKVNSTVHPWMVKVVGAAMHPEVEARYPAAGCLLADLLRMKNNIPPAGPFNHF